MIIVIATYQGSDCPQPEHPSIVDTTKFNAHLAKWVEDAPPNEFGEVELFLKDAPAQSESWLEEQIAGAEIYPPATVEKIVIIWC